LVKNGICDHIQKEGMGFHGEWKFSQSMSLDITVLGGAVTKRQVWMDGWMEGSIRRTSGRHT